MMTYYFSNPGVICGEITLRMKSKDPDKFSWPGFFIVTALSFFIFSIVIKLLNGSPVHASWFFKAGFVSIGFFAIAFAYSLSPKPDSKKRKRLSRASAGTD